MNSYHSSEDYFLLDSPYVHVCNKNPVFSGICRTYRKAKPQIEKLGIELYVECDFEFSVFYNGCVLSAGFESWLSNDVGTKIIDKTNLAHRLNEFINVLRHLMRFAENEGRSLLNKATLERLIDRIFL